MFKVNYCHICKLWLSRMEWHRQSGKSCSNVWLLLSKVSGPHSWLPWAGLQQVCKLVKVTSIWLLFVTWIILIQIWRYCVSFPSSLYSWRGNHFTSCTICCQCYLTTDLSFVLHGRKHTQPRVYQRPAYGLDKFSLHIVRYSHPYIIGLTYRDKIKQM